jgi:nucleotide-binding universal stress UspA family protein
VDWKLIVVGYDRSHVSNRALARAGDIAEATGATLVVTSSGRVLPSGAAAHGLGPFDPADSPEQHREELLHAKELLSNHNVTTEFELAEGEPGEAIVRLAERRNADLIVVGTHDRSFLDRLLHGSVSAEVTRRAPCGVLVVR